MVGLDYEIDNPDIDKCKVELLAQLSMSNLLKVKLKLMLQAFVHTKANNK